MRHERKLGEFGFAGDDHVVPFEVGPLDVRGRAVQLGPMLDQILDRHDYPEPVARLLAEACVLTVLLGTSLKFEGKFILQTRSDGPVDMLVADFATPRSLRAYARFDDERLARRRSLPARPRRSSCSARACWRSPSTRARTRSAIRASSQLDGASLEEVARDLFPPVGADPDRCPALRRQAGAARATTEPGEHWRAGGMLAQFLPEAPERLRLPDLPGGDGDVAAGSDNDPTDNSWQELLALVATVEPTELVDPIVGAERLLYRLFHEHGVRVFEGVKVADECSCSREQGPRHPRRLLGRGDQGQHRGRRDQGQLRVLLEGLRVRPGGVRASWSTE